MYCKEDRDRAREGGRGSEKGRERLGYIKCTHTYTGTQTYKHTQVAAGYMPGSTLVIKNTRGRINMARLGTFRKIYSEDKVEVYSSSLLAFTLIKAVVKLLFFACLWDKQRWKDFIYM